MSDISSKIKKIFEDSILVKQSTIDKDLFDVLKFSGDGIASSIENVRKLMICGNGGGDALKFCDSSFVVPSDATARIQQSHITAGHALLEYIEDKLLMSGYLEKI